MRDICKSFHGIHANKDINLYVKSGEILGLLGENGAGKTTLMNILYGLYQPDSGQIEINAGPPSVSTIPLSPSPMALAWSTNTSC